MGLLANDKVQVTFIGQAFGQVIEMVRNFVMLSDAPAGSSVNQDLQDIASAVTVGGVNDLETPYLAMLSATYLLTFVKAQKILPIRSAYTGISFVGGTPGTNAGATTKTNCSAPITLRTALAGRKQRGTVHIGPIPDPASAAGILTPAYQALMQALAVKLILSFSPPTFVGALVSPIALHKDGTFDLYQGSRLGNTSRVQRRRTVGVGI